MIKNLWLHNLPTVDPGSTQSVALTRPPGSCRQTYIAPAAFCIKDIFYTFQIKIFPSTCLLVGQTFLILSCKQ